MLIKYEALIKKSLIENYAEFEFMLAMSAEVGKLGHTLDISDCSIVAVDVLSNSDKQYFNYLREVGYLYSGSQPAKSYKPGSMEDMFAEKSDLYFDISLFDKLVNVLVEDNNKEFYMWSLDYTNQAYGLYRQTVISYKTLSKMLLHLTAKLFVDIQLGYAVKKPLKLKFNEQESASVSVYIDLYVCKRSVPELDWFIDLDLQLGKNVDLELSVLYKKATHSGRRSRYSVQEKYSQLLESGLKEGSVVALYERKKINVSSPEGRIDNACIAVVRGLKDNPISPTITFTKHYLNRTKEEQATDYYNIDVEKRKFYSDMLRFNVNMVSDTEELYEIGVFERFYDETLLIEPLDCTGKVSKLVTVKGKSVILEMSEIDAIYWLLNEYEIDFDAEWFRSVYNDGKPLMWDLYGEQPDIKNFA